MGLSRRSLCKIADLQKQRPTRWRESLFICLFLFLLISIDCFDIFWHKIAHGRVADRVCLALFQCFHYIAQKKEGKNPVFKASSIGLEEKTDFWN